MVSLTLRLRSRLRAVRTGLKLALHGGSEFPRQCPICGYKGKFSLVGFPPRFDAQCPACGSLERHRLLKLCADKNTDIFAGKKVLHFAAESNVTKFIKPQALDYLTTDLNHASRGVLRLNIEKIDQPDGHWDTIVCLHVLEHVDDKLALPEIFRILKPGGVAVLMVPIAYGWDKTYENIDARDNKQRLLYFGQHDHVRYYGTDFVERVRDVGFAIEQYKAMEPEVSIHGLQRGDTVFKATKPTS